MPATDSSVVSRFAGGLIDILDRVEYSRVHMNVTDNPVYRLRYEAYRREEFVPFNDRGIVSDDLDGTPNAFCYGIHIDGQLVSSIRIHHLTSEHRKGPSMKSCPDVLGPLLDEGQNFIDPSRFTADYDASLAYPALPFLTLRIAVMATEYFAATGCLALVRPEHGPFYKRVFGAVELSDVREYPGLAFPVVCFTARIRRSTCSRFTAATRSSGRRGRSRIKSSRRSTCVDLRCRSRPQRVPRSRRLYAPIVRPSQPSEFKLRA